MSVSFSRIKTDRGRIARICSIAVLASILFGAAIIRQMFHPTKTLLGQMSSSIAPATSASFVWSDTNADGFPDGLSLRGSDAENFRRWLALIAEYQFYRVSPRWQPEQRDCAGLVRFAMREALKKHTRTWVVDFGADARFVAAAPEDVSGYNFDEGPVGDRLFRSRDGQFQASDLNDGTLTQFADARTLRAFNTRFISRDFSRAKPGDLIFFYEPRLRNFPFHVMLFLGQPAWESDGARDWVVYHTGATATDPGVVKKVRLADLLNHPDKRWHPVQTNSGFLGFYRLKIID